MGLLFEAVNWPPLQCQSCGGGKLRSEAPDYLAPKELYIWCSECGAEQERYFNRSEKFNEQSAVNRS